MRCEKFITVGGQKMLKEESNSVEQNEKVLKSELN